MDLEETGWDGRDLFHLAEVKDKWWASTNTVMTLGVL